MEYLKKVDGKAVCKQIQIEKEGNMVFMASRGLISYTKYAPAYYNQRKVQHANPDMFKDRPSKTCDKYIETFCVCSHLSVEYFNLGKEDEYCRVYKNK